MFKIGDIVEITEESDATGMLDFKKGKAYEVELYAGGMVSVVNESGKTGWYHKNHFKLKEDTKVEKKECLFKEGQIVWDIVRGRGVIRRVDTETTRSIGAMPVIVVFDSGEQRDYSYGGVSNLPVAPAFMCKRTLFFSEPKIEAATEPAFEPTLKKGDVVIISCFKDRSDTSEFKIRVVEDESEEFIYTEGNDPWDKDGRDFYRLGEKINFK